VEVKNMANVHTTISTTAMEKIKDLQERGGYGTQRNVLEIAVDRLHREELGGWTRLELQEGGEAVDLLVITNEAAANEAAGRDLFAGPAVHGPDRAIPAHELSTEVINEIVGPAGAGYLQHGRALLYAGTGEEQEALRARFHHWCAFEGGDAPYGEAFGW
jgi:hypothetical protein